MYPSIPVVSFFWRESARTNSLREFFSCLTSNSSPKSIVTTPPRAEEKWSIFPPGSPNSATSAKKPSSAILSAALALSSSAVSRRNFVQATTRAEELAVPEFIGMLPRIRQSQPEGKRTPFLLSTFTALFR